PSLWRSPMFRGCSMDHSEPRKMARSSAIISVWDDLPASRERVDRGRFVAAALARVPRRTRRAGTRGVAESPHRWGPRPNHDVEARQQLVPHCSTGSPLGASSRKALAGLVRTLGVPIEAGDPVLQSLSRETQISCGSGTVSVVALKQ